MFSMRTAGVQLRRVHSLELQLEFQLETQEDYTVYKIDYSAVAVKPEVACKLLK